MVTRWHLINLPVRLRGHSRHGTVIKDVVIEWPSGQVTGFILHSNVFRSRFLPLCPGVAITPRGVELAHRGLIEPRPRKWVKQTLQLDWITRRIPVHNAHGQLLGILNDAVIDEHSGLVKDLVISQGLLADLIKGSLRLPLDTLAVSDDASKETKIYERGYAKGEREETLK